MNVAENNIQEEASSLTRGFSQRGTSVIHLWYPNSMLSTSEIDARNLGRELGVLRCYRDGITMLNEGGKIENGNRNHFHKEQLWL